MNVNFDKEQFAITFATALETLAGSEKITKDMLRGLSRSVLEAHHATEDVQYINRLLPTLSPINHRAMVEFFKAFGGFMFDETEKRFTKKHKKTYDAKHILSLAFLENPMNNIWSWSERHLNVEKKPERSLTDRIKDDVSKWLAKAAKDKVSQASILEAVFSAGIEPDAVMVAFEHMGLEFATTEQE